MSQSTESSSETTPTTLAMVLILNQAELFSEMHMEDQDTDTLNGAAM
jgi:hypothetical protein